MGRKPDFFGDQHYLHLRDLWIEVCAFLSDPKAYRTAHKLERNRRAAGQAQYDANPAAYIQFLFDDKSPDQTQQH